MPRISPARRDRPALRRPARDADRDLGQGDQLRRDHGQFRPARTRSPASLMKAAAAQLFTDEFIATLRMVERGFPRDELKGSWAGAAGHPQFLPSVYIRLAVDGDGDGRADIWRSASRRARLDRQLSAQRRLAARACPGGRRCACPRASTAPPSPTACARRAAPPVFARHSRWLTAGEWRRLGIANSACPTARWPR